MYEEKKKKKKIEKSKKTSGKNKFQKKKIEMKIPKLEIRDNSILKKIDWKKLGIKLGILFLTMLLLIFIMARLNKHQKR